MNTNALSKPQAIVAFWREAGPGRWFSRDPQFDTEVSARLRTAHDAAASGALDGWTETAEGALALLILLDQAPRNMFRGTPRAFATDARARGIADAAIAAGLDQQTPREMRSFFYLPFMHSEDLADQERCVGLYRAFGDENGLNYAIIHRDAIARFGRFPHRNPILGRTMTAEEQAYLDEGGFTG